MLIAAIIVGGIVTVIIVPTILNYRFKNIKDKREKEIEKLKHQKEMMALEIEKEKISLKLLEEENRKYDNLLSEK